MSDRSTRRSPLDASAGRTWRALPAGTALTLIKRNPAGEEVARYPGTVLAAPAPAPTSTSASTSAPWLVVEAIWGPTPVVLDGLRFVPGDRLVEYFSPTEPINAFAVFAPDGMLRGWYANAAYPAWLDFATDPPTLTWHDLYVDVVALPDGATAVRDEDELAESGLADRHPDLAALILAARDEILARLARGAFPFSGATTSGSGDSSPNVAADTPKPPNSYAEESESTEADVHPH